MPSTLAVRHRLSVIRRDSRALHSRTRGLEPSASVACGFVETVELSQTVLMRGLASETISEVDGPGGLFQEY